MVKKTSLAKRFREFRESQGWSLQAIQDELGIHRQTWSKWERGEQTPATATILLVLAMEWAHTENRLEDLVDYVQQNGRWLEVED